MPRTSCGAPMAFGCSRWTTAGAGSSPPSSIGAECVGWHAASAATALPPSTDLHGASGLYGSTAAGAARGLALRMDHGSQYADHFTNQIKFSHPAVLRLRRRAPDQRRRRAVQSHAEGSRSSMVASTATSRSCVDAVWTSSNSTMPVDRRKERLPEPRSSSSGVARRDLNQASSTRETKTCVQGTGLRYTSSSKPPSVSSPCRENAYKWRNFCRASSSIDQQNCAAGSA